jgi:hypothetical protein
MLLLIKKTINYLYNQPLHKVVIYFVCEATK